MFGAQSIAGDQFNIGLTEPIDNNSQVHMSLGISYSYQPAGQVSLIDVNGVRLTSSAGGQDDGVAENGALITAGGIGDDIANPPDPYGPDIDPRYDDELYNLRPLLNNGDVLITVDTVNPSNDDNIFFAAFSVTGAAIVGEGCVLTPNFASVPVGNQHTITATLQDDNGNRIPNRQIDFEVVSGPHAGTTGSDVTDANGEATFSYTGTSTGTDVIDASFINSQGQLQYSNNTASVEWTQLTGACCDVEMVPDTSPVIVPQGGVFWYTGTVGNPSQNPIVTDVWVGIKWQNVFYEARLFPDIALEPYEDISSHIGQHVCHDVCPSTFMYYAFCGDHSTMTACDSVWFPVTVTHARIAGGADTWMLEGEWGVEDLLPTEVSLVGNYPNPFNAQTNITFDLPVAGNVSLGIYNVMGQEVATLVNGQMEAGQHTITWDAANFSSGVYFSKLQIGENVITKKMNLLK